MPQMLKCREDAVAGFLSVRPEDVGLCSTRLERVDGWMRRQVDEGRLPGVQVMVMRGSGIAFSREYGFADVARGKRMAPDTIVRIYSMTKPLTSVAIMMLYEEGRFQLDDPISRFLPAFRDMRVAVGGMWGKIDTVPAEREITFRDLLSHTSGLTYGFLQSTLIDQIYRDRGIDFQTSASSLEELVDEAAKVPLLAQPGAEWNYSISTDVLGRLVEVISGKSFGDFLRQRVIGPLGMVDTDFHIAKDKIERFASNYTRGPDGRPKLIDDAIDGPFATPRPIASGGGGLVGTAADYMRFCRFMLNRGELDGVRLLGRKTVELMTSNQLGGDMAEMGQPRFSESPYFGIGFGLGFSVMLDPAKAQIVGTPGEYAWGGAASTAFWCDPVEDMAVVLLTQLMPSSTYPIRRELRVLTYQALL